MARLQVRRFPCLSDNYGFLAHDPETGETASIDTPDAQAILDAAREAGWTITQIWNTHHHFDHAGGNEALKAATGAKVTAPGGEHAPIAAVDRWVEDGDTVALGAKTARVIHVPGHTLGHIAYVFDEDHVAFVGDTLFAMGCGRMFEGKPDQFWNSLSRLRALPDDTLVYCAHEYTESNARFAAHFAPDDEAIAERFETVKASRARGEPTVPTSIGAEKATNPFLRADEPAMAALAGLPGASPEEVFAEIRRRKDSF